MTVFVVVHYPLLHHARAAVEINALRYRMQAWAVSGYELVRGDPIPDAGDHAAKWETSLMLALYPDLVEIDRLPRDPNDLVSVMTGRVGRPPYEASREFGEYGLGLIQERVVAKVDQMLGVGG